MNSDSLLSFRKFIVFNFYSALNSHNLRSHQKIRHAEYQGEGVTITTVRKNRSAVHQPSFNVAATHSQGSSLIISPPPPPNLLNPNSSDMNNSLTMYKSD